MSFLRHHRFCQLGHASSSQPFSTATTSTSRIFSDAKSAGLIAAARSPASIPRLHGLPEVIVTGRANSGKSTLLNAVLGRRSLLSTSKKAGHTSKLNFFRVGMEPGKLVLVDAPGYGVRGRREWGEMFDQYLLTRKELCGVYILFTATHRLNGYDTQMLSHLSSLLSPPPLHTKFAHPSASLALQPKCTFTLQPIITKADLLPSSEGPQTIDRLRKEIRAAAPLCLPALVTSAQVSPPFGIEKVRQSIAEACGLV